jgi:hypothetical protein
MNYLKMHLRVEAILENHAICPGKSHAMTQMPLVSLIQSRQQFNLSTFWSSILVKIKNRLHDTMNLLISEDFSWLGVVMSVLQYAAIGTTTFILMLLFAHYISKFTSYGLYIIYQFVLFGHDCIT